MKQNIPKCVHFPGSIYMIRLAPYISDIQIMRLEPMSGEKPDPRKREFNYLVSRKIYILHGNNVMGWNNSEI